MARAIHRLSKREIKQADARGLLNDGGGLNLQIAEGGSKAWIFRYVRGGEERRMGLGSLITVTLDEARDLALTQRKLLQARIDPLDSRRAQAAELTQERRKLEASTKTFAECAEAYIAANEAKWRNPKHRAQWRASLATYASPVFGSIPVADIGTPLVLEALQKIWSTKTETASRVRGRIEHVLGWATLHGYRSGDNPAKWNKHLEQALPNPAKIIAVEHHPAMPYEELPAFLPRLREQEGIAAIALEFLILCAARTGEVIGARWSEIDHDERIWTVPGQRMKAGIEHRVPLPAQALDVLKRAASMRLRGNQHVFPGGREGSGLSNMAMLALLRRMGQTDITTHGFRATFKTWASERTNYPNRIVETALAHQLEDKAEKAYTRTDLLAKRRRLMNDWAKYCYSPVTSQADNVINLRKEIAG
ncbi:MAG: tyrosine-type recombinase/integrase [Burkholderiaceae bacterium]|nr:tyrosine-type recombinase/integrase [Burkholderiaceae bacterium]